MIIDNGNELLKKIFQLNLFNFHCEDRKKFQKALDTVLFSDDCTQAFLTVYPRAINIIDNKKQQLEHPRKTTADIKTTQKWLRRRQNIIYLA